MNKLYTKAEIKEKDAEVFTAVASSEVEDRQGEVVIQSGWDLKNFKKNPILLYMHDHTKPIGKATRVWLDKATNKLMFKGFISEATDELRGYKQLMADGILNSFSVGFRPTEMDGNQITKSELFEISLVSVPANPEARLLAVKSLEDAGFDNKVINKVVGDNDEEDLESLKAELKEAKELAREALEQANIAVKGLQYLAPQRSKQETVSKRLQSAKLLARTSDLLIVESKSEKTVSRAKLIKRTSEKLISELKGDL
jgi:HK97 family phage prohead protease